jgi:GTP-binding protein
MIMKVAILGRPNVGKSTLFNRLVGKKIALVADTPGVTRDWRSMPARLGDLKFDIIDTAGLRGFEAEDLIQQIEHQTAKILASTDAILFVVDAMAGLMPGDQDLVRDLQKKVTTPIVLIANKCENPRTQQSLGEFYSLGLGDPLPVSAEHGIGMDELYDILKTFDTTYPAQEDFVEDYAIELEEGDFAEQEAHDVSAHPLRLAIIGRPNAGKSTLINKFLNEERLLTGDTPGITRDSIALDWAYAGREIKLYDTAGLRKRARIEQHLEKLSASDTINAIRFAEVTILVVDALQPLEKQDLTIAKYVIDEGRSLVIAVNKADLQKGEFLKPIQERLEYILPQVKGIPCIGISAKTGKNLDKLMQAVFAQEALWNTRISTSLLNQWLRETTERHPPPLAGSMRIRLKYMTQIKTRPPTFVIFITKPTELPESYLRYLLNQLRYDFDLPGVPIRFQTRKGKNPYLNK